MCLWLRILRGIWIRGVELGQVRGGLGSSSGYRHRRAGKRPSLPPLARHFGGHFGETFSRDILTRHFGLPPAALLACSGDVRVCRQDAEPLQAIQASVNCQFRQTVTPVNAKCILLN